MTVTTVQGVTVNKLTLEQYKELKNANELVSNEVYVISDIDEYIDYIYHYREGKIIKSNNDIVFWNSNYNDFSNVPTDTLLMIEIGQTGNTFNYYLRYINGNYELKMESIGWEHVLYRGTTKDNMALVGHLFDVNTTAGYGMYSTITYFNNNYKEIMDSISRINKSF